MAEDFHRGFGVGVVCGFEAQAGYAHCAEEVFEEALEACGEGLVLGGFPRRTSWGGQGRRTSEGEAKVGNDTFDLVEFGEMGGVDGFVAEHAVDGEVACGAGVFGETVQSPC